MVKIETPSLHGSASPSKVKRKSASSDASFAEELSTETEATSAAGAGFSVQTTEALAILQELNPELKQAKGYGDKLLSMLGHLHMDLLEGRYAGVHLQQMKTLLQAREETCQDPRLETILAEIEQRVEVELAKREKLS